jgi:hypothetical protein
MTINLCIYYFHSVERDGVWLDYDGVYKVDGEHRCRQCARAPFLHDDQYYIRPSRRICKYI